MPCESSGQQGRPSRRRTTGRSLRCSLLARTTTKRYVGPKAEAGPLPSREVKRLTGVAQHSMYAYLAALTHAHVFYRRLKVVEELITKPVKANLEARTDQVNVGVVPFLLPVALFKSCVD